MNDWISVRERLPKDDSPVMVGDASTNDSTTGCYYNEGVIAWAWDDRDAVKQITHWMPIPDLPKPEPELPFRVTESDLYHDRYWVTHRTAGIITHCPKRERAQHVCDRLNLLWQLEKDCQ